MPQRDGEVEIRNDRLTQRLFNWTDADGTGLAFDSSTQVSSSPMMQTDLPDAS